MNLPLRVKFVVEAQEHGHIYTSLAKEKIAATNIPRNIEPSMMEYVDVFLNDLPLGLPPMRDILALY